MAVGGRTHRPLVNKELCQRCSICVGGCPGRVNSDFRGDLETVRGYVYAKTNLLNQKALPPCTGACPLGQKVREYVSLIENSKLREALLTIRKDNPLPGICAYVCHHPCENFCVRGSWDQSVSIRELKRYAFQYEMNNTEEILSVIYGQKSPSQGKKVAVIGAGPAGLACAYDLVMGGCEVEVIDSFKKPGGMLVGGIPWFRLPRRVIEHDVDFIQSLGVRFFMDVRVGEDLTIEEIRNEADSVVVATGAWKDIDLGIIQDRGQGTEKCLNFLKRINDDEGLIVSGKVLVIGGGNAAIDTARSAIRMGAQEVIIVYRRTRNEMPANPEEINAAIREGVRIRYLEAPKRIFVEGGVLKGVELVKMELSTEDKSGRKRPVGIDGSEFFEEADHIIIAIGQRPDVSFLKEQALSALGTISCSIQGMIEGYEGVFAAGDAVGGPSTVVEAMASGKRIARQVFKYLAEVK